MTLPARRLAHRLIASLNSSSTSSACSLPWQQHGLFSDDSGTGSICASRQQQRGYSEAAQLQGSVRRQQRGAYRIDVSIQGYESRYVDAASRAIRDLMLVNFAPKSASVLPGDPYNPGNPVHLALPINENKVPVPWKRTRMTVIRGPHIDKQGMEQFEQRSYKTMLRTSTTDAGEVHWFLDSIKLYEFPGTQIKVHLTSSSFLTPAAIQNQQQDVHAPSLLADHRRHISDYLLPCNTNSNSSSTSQQSATAAAQQQLKEALQSLRETLHAGLLQQRSDLATVAAYQTWHRMRSNAPQSTAPPPPDLAGSSSDILMNPPASAAPGSAGSSATQDSSQAALSKASKAAAFLSAAETAFLNLDLTVLEGHQQYPFHFATYQLGQQVRNNYRSLLLLPEFHSTSLGYSSPSLCYHS